MTGLDRSPRMLEVARLRVALYANGRSSTFVAAPAERTGFPSGSFDVIVGRRILHHVDLRPAAAELARILAPGRRAVLLENSGANPLLDFTRDHLVGRFGIPRLGAKDERPLAAADWRLLKNSFVRVRKSFRSSTSSSSQPAGLPLPLAACRVRLSRLGPPDRAQRAAQVLLPRPGSRRNLGPPAAVRCAQPCAAVLWWSLDAQRELAHPWSPAHADPA